MIKKTSVAVVILAFFFITYILFPLFINSNILGGLKILFLTCLGVSLYHLNKKGNKINSIKQFILPSFLCFFYIQLFFFSSLSILKGMVFFCFFACFAFYATNRICEFFSCFIKLASLFIILFIFTVCIEQGHLYYYRSLIFIEKTTMSIFFTLATSLCLIDFGLKKKKKDLFLLALILFTNIFIVQSKSAIFLFVLNVLILFFLCEPFKRMIKKYKYILLFFSLSVVAIFPSAILPDDIRFGINRIIGNEIFSTTFVRSEDNMDLTYSIREDMHTFGMKIFFENPLIGIGVGNFEKYNRFSGSNVSFLTQPESTWLGILIEGGIVYLLFFVIFFIHNLSVSKKKYKENQDNDMALKSFFINTNYVVLFFFNDFMDLMFWCTTAFFLAGTYINTREDYVC